MIYRIEPGMVHVNDALSRQERRARHRLRRRPLPASGEEPQRPEAEDGREEDQARLDLVA